MIHFRSVSDLSQLVRSSLHRVPRDVDVVIGVPRSGMLVANMLSLALNLPLADVDGFTEGRLLAAGKTRRHAKLDAGFDQLKRALVVDDSIRTGAAMEEAMATLRAKCPNVQFTRLVAYQSNEVARDASDIVLEIVPEPRVFEWNVMHHSVLANSCVDIDGILCCDPTAEQNDDGERYEQFLLAAEPLYLPTKPIRMLVSSRLEKYRSQTEEWLARHQIIYDQLVLLDLPSAKERREKGNHGQFKGSVFRKSDASLFIESELPQVLVGAGKLDANSMIINLQPEENIRVKVMAKQPGLDRDIFVLFVLEHPPCAHRLASRAGS